MIINTLVSYSLLSECIYVQSQILIESENLTYLQDLSCIPGLTSQHSSSSALFSGIKELVLVLIMELNSPSKVKSDY